MLYFCSVKTIYVGQHNENNTEHAAGRVPAPFIRFSKPYTFVLDQDGPFARVGRFCFSAQSKPNQILINQKQVA